MALQNSRVIGIVGGMGPAASNYFATRITALAAARSDQEHPAVIHINDPHIPDRTAYLTGNGADPAPYIRDIIVQLQQMHVDVICIPCNTAHAPRLYEQYSRGIRTPIIHMVAETASYVTQQYGHIKTVAILGTDGTRVGGAYDAAFRGYKVNAVYPKPNDQQTLMRLIYRIKQRGVQLHEDVSTLKDVLDHMQAEICIIACTELSMLYHLLREQYDHIQIVDSLEVLADQVLSYVNHPYTDSIHTLPPRKALVAKSSVKA